MHKAFPISLCVVLTLIVVALAVMTVAYLFRDYMKHPWTRDGQVRAQVVQIASRVSAPIIELPIVDNQSVKKGDLLFKVDPRTFQAAVEQVQAALKTAQAHAAEAKVEAERARSIYQKDKGAIAELSVIQKENARDAAVASVAEAQAHLQSAELNLEFTEVHAPVDGFITNLRLRHGSQTVANQAALALIDSHSFWVHGFFKETQIKYVHAGDKAVIKLMAYPKQPLEGVVDSLGWGIAQQDGSPGVDLLPNVNPTFDWIRLAQRVPVRVKLTEVPSGVELRVGTTASVFVMAGE
jgi:RND family efflux transporter MFP subunit